MVDTDDLLEWDERFWAPIKYLCRPCAMRVNPQLAQEKDRQNFEDLERVRKEHGRFGFGPTGLTGPMACPGCGGRRSWPIVDPQIEPNP
jgi:hypothetical protein